MARVFVPVFVLAILLAGLDFGSCIQCFQCNSQIDPTCNDPFSAGRYLTDCNSQDSINFNLRYLQQIFPGAINDGVTGVARFCHKIVTQTGTTIRTCMDADPTDPDHSCRLLDSVSRNSNDWGRTIRHCSVCNRDGCNGAGSISISYPLMLLTAAVSYYFYKY